MSFADAGTATLAVDDFRITFLTDANDSVAGAKEQDLQDITVVLGVDEP